VPTPDFEDWLARQEVAEEDITSVEAYQDMARDEWGLKGGSLDVSEAYYRERYQGLEAYGIRPIEREYLYQNEPFAETRYAISGERGLFGKWRAYEIAKDRATEAGDYEMADIFELRLSEMEAFPERMRTIYQVPRGEE
jgi:hypothetical protein